MSISSIKPQYSTLAKGLTTLKNPNKEWGTLLIEIPADIGRAYSGYKRGGIIEGAEKFRKDMISGIVWLFGIPLFNNAGNFLFEKLAKLPMDIDYDEKTIERTLEYIANKKNTDGLNVKDLEKYGKEFANKIKELEISESVKRIKGAKQVITLTSLALNCFLMGIALPKINQAITRKKLQEQKQKDYTPKFDSMKDFQEQTQKNKNIAFKGLGSFLDTAVYCLNNDTRARLISTDAPMIAGRCATARNKYEALEIGLMDGLAILFYNFTLGWSQDILSWAFGSPQTNAKVAQCVVCQDENDLENAIKSLKDKKEIFKLDSFFDKEIVKEIYTQGTNGKFGKINRFIKDEEILEIDTSVKKLLEYLSQNNKVYKNGKINIKEAQKLVKKLNIKNSIFYAVGTAISVLGLGIWIPKFVYGITKKITGKDGFIGIEEENKKQL